MKNLTKNDPKTETYTIGSGWWCSQEQESEVNPKRQLPGDPLVRAVTFFGIWLDSINRTTTPHSIVVVDSKSPTKPDPELRKQVAWVELPFNAKHSVDHIGRWSGWTRSVLMGGEYALLSDTEYFVYVEQDCLLVGNGIIEHCIANMDRDLMFGDGRGTPQPLQQSFFIIRRRRLCSFLANLAALRHDDKDVSPEWKFVFASWRPFVILSNLGLMKGRVARHSARILARALFFQFLPVGSGRSRPLPVDDQFWYFQHGKKQEIADYLEAVKESERTAGEKADQSEP